MPRRSILCAAVSLMSPAFILAQTPVLPQIEQSRQSTGPPATVDLQGQRNAPPTGNFDGTSTSDDAFGTQVIFKRQEKPQPFSAFAGMAAFITNNVALTTRDPQEDSFLTASAGVGFSQRFAYNLRFDAGVQASAYRYNRFPQLDFQSTDFSAGVSWSPAQLLGAEVIMRYTFTDLTTAVRVREFYKNHAILLGVQKVVPVSRAQAVYVGASAQWSFADPKPAGRDEYVAYAGYRAQFTRRIGVDLYYRYGFYVYRFGDGRKDQNNTLSLAINYTPTDWLSFSTTGFLGFNRSNRATFNYDVGNVGVGLQSLLRF